MGPRWRQFSPGLIQDAQSLLVNQGTQIGRTFHDLVNLSANAVRLRPFFRRRLIPLDVPIIGEGVDCRRIPPNLLSKVRKLLDADIDRCHRVPDPTDGQ